MGPELNQNQFRNPRLGSARYRPVSAAPAETFPILHRVAERSSLSGYPPSEQSLQPPLGLSEIKARDGDDESSASLAFPLSPQSRLVTLNTLSDSSRNPSKTETLSNFSLSFSSQAPLVSPFLSHGRYAMLSNLSFAISYHSIFYLLFFYSYNWFACNCNVLTDTRPFRLLKTFSWIMIGC